MFLSKLGYSELVQRLFEKMTFFLVDPLPMLALQIEQYRAQLSVFPHGHQGPRGQNMLEEMEQELLLR